MLLFFLFVYLSCACEDDPVCKVEIDEFLWEGGRRRAESDDTARRRFARHRFKLPCYKPHHSKHIKFRPTEKHSGVHVFQCKMLCTRRSWCKSFNYAKDSKTCYLFKIGPKAVGLTRNSGLTTNYERMSCLEFSKNGGKQGSLDTLYGIRDTFIYGITPRSDRWGNSVYLYGNENCYAVLWSNPDCTGAQYRVDGKPGAKEGDVQYIPLTDTPVRNNVKCVHVWSAKDYWNEVIASQQGRRRVVLDDVRAESNFKAYDPLCDYVLAEHLDFGNNATIKAATTTLYDDCEKSFYDKERRMQCKFYVKAVSEVLDDRVLAETFKQDENAKNATLQTHYERCGTITNRLNDALEEEDNGITIIEQDGEDYFELEEGSADGVVTSALSLGAMISMWLGTTLVRVCRDFDAATGAWKWL